ncbi:MULTISPECIES: hypothetical protein [Nocardioides]|uniref:Uncharacterized protein n=1 Tax=Nocardioides vastitatis TaxID=2568655 RepID=A0ABW0ZJV9_9ACTN|nr:hypothetical protein [Nocardioides sp.]THI96799.1 hypothetical protein E7Z54_16205 [Nocardioides sp.]
MNEMHYRSASSFGGRDALDAARQAWEWHGEICHVRTNESQTDGVVGALDLPDRRHVEVFVDSVDDDVLSTVEKWAVADEWVMRAVLPLAGLGRAHEALRERGCELQGYWVRDDGRVAFGHVEMA